MPLFYLQWCYIVLYIQSFLSWLWLPIVVHFLLRYYDAIFQWFVFSHFTFFPNSFFLIYLLSNAESVTFKHLYFMHLQIIYNRAFRVTLRNFKVHFIMLKSFFTFQLEPCNMCIYSSLRLHDNICIFRNIFLPYLLCPSLWLSMCISWYIPPLHV